MSHDDPERDPQGRFGKGNKQGRKSSRKPRNLKEVQVEAQKYGIVALNCLVEILQFGEDKDAINAAKEILARAYGKSPEIIVGVEATGNSIIEVIFSDESET